MKFFRTKVAGFTLIELLVNMVIIGILSTVSLATFKDFDRRAKRTKAQVEMKQILQGIITLQIDTGLTVGGLAMDPCVKNPEFDLADDDAGLLNHNGNNFPGWGGPYLEGDGLDPWENPYVIDHDYYCRDYIQGCEGVCAENDCVDSAYVVAAVSTAGPDGIFNNYDSGEAIVLLCEN